MKVFRLAILTGLLAVPAAAAAQTAQEYSVQLSGLYNSYDDQFIRPGAGLELQGRWNMSAFSIGGGFQTSFHSTVTDYYSVDFNMNGIFVEPRLVVFVGSDAFAPYASARVASTRGSWEDDGWTVQMGGTTFNAGGGMLFRIGDRTNVDVGVTVGSTRFGGYGEAHWTRGRAMRAGVALGL
jgi:hypothetical protein